MTQPKPNIWKSSFNTELLRAAAQILLEKQGAPRLMDNTRKRCFTRKPTAELPIQSEEKPGKMRVSDSALHLHGAKMGRRIHEIK